jgi:hypothetical protein
VTAGNPREHPPEQVEQIAPSMREFGWTIPVLLDELGEIIAGHGWVLAAPLLGWTEAQVMIARGWSEAQKRAYRIADPFLGTGSTLIAAESLGRVCLGLEIEPRYVDICIKRWQQLTGARRAARGQRRNLQLEAHQWRSGARSRSPATCGRLTAGQGTGRSTRMSPSRPASCSSRPRS